MNVCALRRAPSKQKALADTESVWNSAPVLAWCGMWRGQDVAVGIWPYRFLHHPTSSTPPPPAPAIVPSLTPNSSSEGGGFGSSVYHLPISGINIYEPAPPTGPTRQPLETLGNFRGWYIRTEQLQHNCSWTVKHQCVDLLAEGLWEELLDDEQPDITVMDWFEDSRLDVCVYELHVWLLAADRHTIIAQHHVAPRTSGRGPPGRWVQVSHVFRQYGPGVRFVHFLHKTKNRMEAGGLRRTRVTDSSVSVQFRE
ncbi:PREDICTED: F-box only protein 50 [Myotis brandtii]|uniref:F-box only protein 50 n=1 Tax=Myotis brandtii TaxID=109478 RepID=UPI00070425A5|nr:PREDICTED: F-box only protein 50 [Myotis brandtii]